MENTEKLYEKIESGEFEEVLQIKVDNNTNLVVYENVRDKCSKTLKIVLKKSETNEVVLDFSNFIYFANKRNFGAIKIEKQSSGFFANPERLKVGMPSEALKDPKEIFGLLHEIGHIHNDLISPLPFRKQLQKLKEANQPEVKSGN